MNRFCRLTLASLIHTALITQSVLAEAPSVIPSEQPVQPTSIAPIPQHNIAQTSAKPRKEEETNYSQRIKEAEDHAFTGITPLQTPPTRLVNLETANQLPAGTVQVTGGFHQTLKGNGTGFQIYSAGLDWAISDRVQLNLSGDFYQDPPGRAIAGERYGLTIASGALSTKVRWLNQAKFSASVLSSVGSLYLSDPLPGSVRTTGNERHTTTTVGTLQVPFTYTVDPKLQLHVTPGVVFLPDSIKGNPSFGTFFNLGAGISWQPSDRVTLFANGNFPLGSGGNAIRSSNGSVFRKPIWATGLQYAVSPRFAAELYATNAFGATPTTSLLAFIPDGDQVLLGANLKYLFDLGQNYPQSWRSPLRPISDRDRQLWLDGLTLSTANTVAPDVIRLRGSVNTGESYSVNLAYGLAQDLQLELMLDEPAGEGLSSRARGGTSAKFGAAAKLRLFDQTQGDAVSLALKIGGSKDYTPRVGVGTLNIELPIVYQASPKVALFLNPKASFNGQAKPIGVGIGVNHALTDRFQLIGEVTPVFNDFRTVWSAGLRYYDPKVGFGADLYAGNAVYQQGLGSLSGDRATQVGLNLHWTLGRNRL